MQKAGAIVALVAGNFGVFAAGFTLYTGQLGSVLGVEGADFYIVPGWAGLAFSLLTILFGAIAIVAKGPAPGILVIVCAVCGALVGGGLTTIPLVIAAVGGILVLKGRRQAKR